MAAGAGGDRSLKETPTWAVAVVCAGFVIISLLIEHGIHSLGKWFQKRQKKSMTEALDKIKAELMLLGFISLLITVGTTFISKICIPTHLGNTMLPCKKSKNNDYVYGKLDNGGNDRRKLLSYAENKIWHRVLAAPAGEDYCSKHGKISLISQSGVHQLHIFIFVLAVFHVVYSVITMALAKAKVKKWKTWESETSSFEYQFTNDPARFRFTRQTSFVRRHSGMSTTRGIRWIVAFFRQFFASVSKVDYLTMRHGFINAHLAPNSKFDFHKYIKRSMEDDFQVVVGVSFPLWFFCVIFLLLNVYKWNTLTWLSFMPLVILLLVGTKLELIIMEMALEIQERSSVTKGAPVVEPNNKYFWFERPDWILFLLHFTLFQNAFEMAYFFWICVEFGFRSCFHEDLVAILSRIILGVAVQILCSYSTFPLYALVTQMGSHMKKAIFEEQTAKALMKWQKAAKDRRKLRKDGGEGSSVFISEENSPFQGTSPIHVLHKETTPNPGTSPIHLLHKHKYRSDQADIESDLSARPYQSDTELSEIEGSNHDVKESRTQGHQQTNEELANSDFTFVKL